MAGRSPRAAARPSTNSVSDTTGMSTSGYSQRMMFFESRIFPPPEQGTVCRQLSSAERPLDNFSRQSVHVEAVSATTEQALTLEQLVRPADDRQIDDREDGRDVHQRRRGEQE